MSDPRSVTLAAARRAVVRNRAPGLHFLGHFLGIRFRRVERGYVVVTLPMSLQVTDGKVTARSPIAIICDIALGASIRTMTGPNVRITTTSLKLAIAGDLPLADFVAEAHALQVGDGVAIAQGAVRTTGGAFAASACATFVIDKVSAAGGVRQPWEVTDQTESDGDELEPPATFTADEAEQLEDVRRGLDSDTPGWASLFGLEDADLSQAAVVKQTFTPIAMNRSGSGIQGGVLFGLGMAALDGLAQSELGRADVTALELVFLRPMQSGVAFATASAERIGKRTVSASLKLASVDEVAAVGTGSATIGGG